MKEIPLELQGKEVQKFEGISFKVEQNKDLVDSYWEWLDIRELFRQPFSPDMIEKYFEGWKKLSDNYYKKFNRNTYSWNYEVAENNVHYLNAMQLNPKPKTLSDFIDCCDNLDIKLIWKKQNDSKTN